MKLRIARLVSSGFGSGYSPIVSGTTGSLALIPVWFLLTRYLGVDTLTEQVVCALFIALLGCLAVSIVATAEARTQSADAKYDPSFIVVDEWLGMYVSLIGVSTGDWRSIVAAFVLFRIFDIIKPGPVRTVEAIRPPWGVMLDDLLAGIIVVVLLTTLRVALA